MKRDEEEEARRDEARRGEGGEARGGRGGETKQNDNKERREEEETQDEEEERHDETRRGLALLSFLFSFFVITLRAQGRCTPYVCFSLANIISNF